MDLVEEEEAATAAAIMAAMEVAATAAAIMAAMEVAAMEVAATAAAIIVAMEVAATAAAIMAAMEVAATAAAIMDLISLTPINLLVQKGGKTEVMEILLTTLNMKMVGAEEKGECPMRAILQTRQISNPFLQALSLI